MALISVVSAKGSPGVTAATVAMAALWPTDCLLADLDPAGGDLALRYTDPQGVLLRTDDGLVSLGAAMRRGAGTDITPHLQQVSGGLDVLVGVSSPEQAVGLGPVWHTLGSALAASDVDVLADCGRFVPGSPTTSVLEASGAVVFVTALEVTALAHLRERLRGLSQQLGFGRPGATPVGVIVRAPERQGSAAGDVQRLLDSSGLLVPVVGQVAEDRKGVTALEQQRGGAHRSSFVRSVRGVVPGVHRLVRHTATV